MSLNGLKYIVKEPKFILYYVDKYLKIRIRDDLYLRIVYKKIFNRELDLKNPKTFNEKLQWLKLYDRNPQYTEMVDKYQVKKYIADLIGEEYIIPTLGVYDKFDDIDFEKLPNQFVLKCTHDSGSTIVCRDKDNFDYKQTKKKINKLLKKNFFYGGREWPYKNVKPRIIVEKFMQNGEEKELKDYKFYCFSGIPKFLYVSEGLENHETARISFFDMNFNFEDFSRTDYKKMDKKPDKPVNFEKMKELAAKLSKGIPFVRIDLYEINGQLYFSEFTFSPCSGFMLFNPEEYDEIVGNLLVLPGEKNNEK